MIEKEGKPTGVLSQKGVKEAVSWRQAIKWMAGSNLSLPDTERGDPPLIFKNPVWCEEFEPAWAGKKSSLLLIGLQDIKCFSWTGITRYGGSSVNSASLEAIHRTSTAPDLQTTIQEKLCAHC